MAANVEIKARVRDKAESLRRIQEVSDSAPVLLRQEDTFFYGPRGRLKLRVLAPDRAQLVYYERSDDAGPKLSRYLLAETDQPEPLRTVLAAALGVRGVVRKERWLYMAGQTRIHLDEVEGLGCFLELEVVLREGQTNEEGQRTAEALMARLGIQPEDLVNVAYIDLLEKSEPVDNALRREVNPFAIGAGFWPTACDKVG